MSLYREHIPQGPFRAKKELILASASPRRQTLFALLGLDFRVLPARFQEPRFAWGQDPQEYALSMAREKSRLVSEKYPDAMVLGADTIVVLDQEVLGKPESREHALEMLIRLQNSTHTVITGVTLTCGQDRVEKSFAASTKVLMIPADQSVLGAYIDTGEPWDKAGAYAIQGVGAFLIRELEGSYTNVVGLPLDLVLEKLLDLGAVEIASGDRT